MKKIALAAAFTVAATTAFAGGMDAPVMEPEVIVETAASSSSAGIIVPLVLLAIVAAAVAE
ncbi:hypothetical protein [Thalassobius sp. MITS945101]|uniref:hypothetical protein n=1 Tax=Thalassobius sp. MITS945101 TaxID=3096994 RepID=UPI00399C394D